MNTPLKNIFHTSKSKRQTKVYQHLLWGFFIVLLVGCGKSYSKEIETTMSPTEPVGEVSTDLPIITDLSKQSLEEIDFNNLGDLTLLSTIEVDKLFPGVSQRASMNLWFSDSSQFIISTQQDDDYGIQRISIGDFQLHEFQPTDTLNTIVISDDRVVTYLAGVQILNEPDYEIELSSYEDYCEEGSVSQIVVLPDNKVITGHQHYGDITDSYGISRLLVWDQNKNYCKVLLEAFEGRISSLSVSKDGQHISYGVLSSEFDEENEFYTVKTATKVFDLLTNRELCSFDGLDSLFLENNKLLVYNPRDKYFSINDITTCIQESKFETKGVLTGFNVDKNCSMLTTVSKDYLRIYDIEEGKLLFTKELSAISVNIAIVNFSPDTRFLLIGLPRYSSVEKDQIMILGVPSKY